MERGAKVDPGAPGAGARFPRATVVRAAGVRSVLEAGHRTRHPRPQHSSDSGYARFDSEWEGSDGEMLPFQTNAFRMVNEWRPVQDTVSSWVCHGALFRHPDLKIAVIESGASWLAVDGHARRHLQKKAPRVSA